MSEISKSPSKGSYRFRVLDVKTPLFWFVLYTYREFGGRVIEYRFWRGSILPDDFKSRWWIHGLCWELIPFAGAFPQRLETFNEQALRFRDAIYKSDIFGELRDDAAELFVLTMQTLLSNDSNLLQRTVAQMQELVDEDDWPDEINV